MGGVALGAATNHHGGGPNVTITSGFSSKSAKYGLAGRVDDDAAITHLSWSVKGGVEHALRPAKIFSALVVLKQGENDILVKAVDKAGRKSSAMIVINYGQEMGPGMLASSAKGRAALHKLIDRQMQAMRDRLSKEAPPPATQSAEESVKTLDSSVANLKKTLASLGASTVPTPESEEGSSVVAKKKSPPEKRVDNTAPLIEITSSRDTVSTNYVLAGSATDDTGVSRLTVSLNKNKPKPIKLNHGRFQIPLVLKHGSNVVLVAVADASGHATSQRLEVIVKSPTSDQLIDAAVKRGKLGKNKALVYKIYAAFGVPKVPEKYLGDDSGVTDNHILDEAVSRFNELPVSVKKKIIPFFIPPFYKGSWVTELHKSDNSLAANYSQDPSGAPGYHIRSAVFVKTYSKNGINKTGSWGLGGTVSNRVHHGVIGVSTIYVPPCKLYPGVCQVESGWRYIDGKHVRIWYLNKHFPSDDKADKNGEAYFHPIDLKKETYKQQAEHLLTAMEKHIWPRLTKVMDRKPISDGDLLTNGGNGLLDIAIVPGYLHMKGAAKPDVLGVALKNTSLVGFAGGDFALPYLHFGCRHEPVYIELRRTLSDKVMHDDLAHEFMHALQWAYKTKNCTEDYSWLMESTATWAIDYVFKDDNWEHKFSADFITNPEIPLDKVGNKHEYWAYLFFFYLRWNLQKPELIRYAWEATEHDPPGIKAVIDALGRLKKTLSDVFPVFTVLNTNVPPVNKYRHWDFMDGAEDRKKNIHDYAMYEPLFHPLGGKGDIAAPFMKDKPLKHLSARDFELVFPGGKSASDEVRSVAVYNGYSYKLSIRKRPEGGLKGPVPVETLPVDTWALDALPNAEKHGRRVESTLMLHNKWLHSAKTGKAYATLGPGIMFCHDPGDVNDALVMIPSNSRKKGAGSKLKPVGHSPLVWESDIGCGPWKGEIVARDSGDGQSGAHWTFDTKFTTGNAVQKVSPMFTDKQLQAADSSGAPLPATAFGFAASTSGSEPKRVGMWSLPLGSHFLQYFGAVMSFGTGQTTWTVHGGCDSQGSGQYKVVVVLITYNFVPRGEMRRHMTLAATPESYLAHPLNQHRAELPYQRQDDSGKCYTAHRSEMNVQPIFGKFKPDDGAHASGEIRGADYLNGKKGCQAFGIELETGRKDPKPESPTC